jgi:hypothetical protein
LDLWNCPFSSFSSFMFTWSNFNHFCFLVYTLKVLWLPLVFCFVLFSVKYLHDSFFIMDLLFDIPLRAILEVWIFNAISLYNVCNF